MLLQLLIEVGPPGIGQNLINMSYHSWLTTETERWEGIGRGAFRALKVAGIKDATVAVANIRIFDVASTPSVCERVAYRCVEFALENPSSPFSESGDPYPLGAYKQQRKELMREFGCD